MLNKLFWLFTCLSAMGAHGWVSSVAKKIRDVADKIKIVERHHSFVLPLGSQHVYWNFGGSTVVTHKVIRLTPSTQDRKGWLWNEYPIESANFEVDFKIKVNSDPHFGGDGFGLWFITGEQDPVYSKNPGELSGPLFGMRKDFQGVGVCFDTYDNDARRDNPSVFVLSNPDGTKDISDHDDDFSSSMVKTIPDEGLLDAVQQTRQKDPAFKCTVSIRNTNKVHTIKVKYLNKVMSVYVDDGTSGFKFCLSVRLDDFTSLIDYHMVLTAATGQVADNHDIFEVRTRYLDDTDLGIDDSMMEALGSAGAAGDQTSPLSLILIIAGLGITGYSGYQLLTLRTLQKQNIDVVKICETVNGQVKPHFILHTILTLTFFGFGYFVAGIINLPFVFYRLWCLIKSKVEFTVADIEGRGTGRFDLSANSQLTACTVCYAVYAVYYMVLLW